MSNFKNFYLNEDKKYYQLYLDLDGVLTDFNGRFRELIGHDPQEFEKKYGSELFYLAIEEHGEKFWSEMNWLIDGKQLWNYVKHLSPSILTRPIEHESCYSGKVLWLNNNLGKGIQYVIDKDKAKYANENALLIDDNEENVRKFIEAGGQAILYKDSAQTINTLKKFYGI